MAKLTWYLFNMAIPLPVVTLEELTLYFYIACGVAAGLLVVLLILVIALFVRVNRLAADGSMRDVRAENKWWNFRRMTRAEYILGQRNMVARLAERVRTIPPLSQG
ncbi:uncharacterized protein LOC105284399 isoform X3 [Ooceraea biroi]|uniref:uncharacterized protein LOC105284399 isoform X3 n=1 Tax=Ooceraea biroi TaxID=2015173 RepID=UPI0005BBCDDF|nr:uncharacterized protein LOC105284399 isoform X3 [Ooceraea biroi]